MLIQSEFSQSIAFDFCSKKLNISLFNLDKYSEDPEKIDIVKTDEVSNDEKVYVDES